MLKINVDEIGSGLTLKESYPATAFPELKALQDEGEMTFARLLEFELELQRLGGIITIDGRLAGVALMNCGHCLVDYKQAVAGDFSLKAVPEATRTPAAAAETELGAGDFDEVFYNGDTLDLHELLQEQVLLSLPLAPLCRADCKGLCAQCGHNLNDGDCGCGRTAGHPAFAGLAGLFES